MSNTDLIALAGVVAALLGALTTWLAMRKQYQAKRLFFNLEIEALLRRQDPKLSQDLEILYRGQPLPSPTLISLDIGNSGYAAVENAIVIVQIPGSQHVIPAYFFEVPAGYEDLWKVHALEKDRCEVRMQHLNPKQVARVRLMIGNAPTGDVQVTCPMPNVQLTEVGTERLNKLSEALLDIAAPQMLSFFRMLR